LQTAVLQNTSTDWDRTHTEGKEMEITGISSLREEKKVERDGCL
jgi:hypothetical protein